MNTVRDTVDRYKEAGVAVWGVTATAPSIIAAWAREHHFGVPILSDYERTVSEAYVGLYSPEDNLPLARTTKRGLVGIGQDGTVRHVWFTDDSPIQPSDEEIGQAIAAATA